MSARSWKAGSWPRVRRFASSAPGRRWGGGSSARGRRWRGPAPAGGSSSRCGGRGRRRGGGRAGARGTRRGKEFLAELLEAGGEEGRGAVGVAEDQAALVDEGAELLLRRRRRTGAAGCRRGRGWGRRGDLRAAGGEVDDLPGQVALELPGEPAGDVGGVAGALVPVGGRLPVAGCRLPVGGRWGGERVLEFAHDQWGRGRGRGTRWLKQVSAGPAPKEPSGFWDCRRASAPRRYQSWRPRYFKPLARPMCSRP